MTGVSGKDKTSYKVEYTNTSTFKVGVEYTPNRYDIRHFLKRWSYRAGFRYGQLQPDVQRRPARAVRRDGGHSGFR